MVGEPAESGSRLVAEGGVGRVDVRAKALDLLARREHSRHELKAKLNQRGFDADLVDEILDELVARDWLSDQRYAEAYVRMRSDKGYGPLRIRNELSERGIADVLVNQAFAESGRDWFALASHVRERKFGVSQPGDFKTRAKQSRFLQYRGFDFEQINAAFER